LCGQPSLGMRSRRAAGRRNPGGGRRRNQGEGRRRGRRRRRRTTPSFLDHDDDDDEVISQVYDTTHISQTIAPISLSTGSLPPPTSGSLWMNTTIGDNKSLVYDERDSTTLSTTVSTSVTSSSLPPTTESRPRHTRRPRRNRNRGSRRRKIQRTSTPTMSVTTQPLFYPDLGQHQAWGREHGRQQHHHEGVSASQLRRLIASIRSKLTMNRDLVTQLPRSLCSTVTSATASERRCWNGTNYVRSVLLIELCKYECHSLTQHIFANGKTDKCRLRQLHVSCTGFVMKYSVEIDGVTLPCLAD